MIIVIKANEYEIYIISFETYNSDIIWIILQYLVII
jgi:hypothetical protein